MVQMVPEIVVENDFEGYFESLVRGFINRKDRTFKHHKIIIDARPYLPSAVQYKSKDGVLNLTFYSALRAGFGRLSRTDILGIIDLL